MSGFLRDYSAFGIDSIALDDLGYILTGDYDRNRMVDRSQALVLVEEQLQRMRDDEGLDIMLEYPNMYALPYAKYVTNMPLESNQFSSVRESVPFMEIVSRGYCTYSGGVLNFSSNMTKEVLKCIEVGASPNFVWTYREPAIAKGTDYSGLFRILRLDLRCCQYLSGDAVSLEKDSGRAHRGPSAGLRECVPDYVRERSGRHSQLRIRAGCRRRCSS